MELTDLYQLIETIAAGANGMRRTEPRAGAPTAEEYSGAEKEIGALLAGMADTRPVVAETAAAPNTDVGTPRWSGASVIAKTLVGGFGALSLLKGLFGGTSAAPRVEAPLPEFALPEPVRQELAYRNDAGDFVKFDRSAGGELRAVSRDPAQITVNINALDSRSFLDHSSDIARALREAMLHAHPVNDVLTEL